MKRVKATGKSPDKEPRRLVTMLDGVTVEGDDEGSMHGASAWASWSGVPL